MEMDRAALADFLRKSRERLRPQEAGLPAGVRRRTPGLRREEVAMLTGMSADYYIRLEQARSTQPSVQILAALARSLRLTDDGRDHLYRLAGHHPPAGRKAGEHIRPGLMYLLDQLTTTPAQILSDLGDLLAQNEMATALFGSVCRINVGSQNIVLNWFTDPLAAAAYPEDERRERGRAHVAALRWAVTRRGPGDQRATELVAKLTRASAEFRELWDLHEVESRKSSVMRVDHPLIGPIVLDCEALLTPTEDQQLLIFTPPPGTNCLEHLDLLRVVGTEQFAGSTS
ncbi:helix-turn-helix transcriptional regulator [Longispora albida]|uniref:helix-turn-helix transcriptional regulator n=1 Tax=Longispora albida TaxID=203523 RepID=UPI00037DBFB3|nr:helix-turn-helix transcriptional regulator [Longispora albida]